MKIHHLNCGSLVAPFINVQAIVYCLLVETSQGLVLIDTGFGTRDYAQPTLKTRFFLHYMGVPRLYEETALAQVQALGYQPRDVKHVIQTHLHIDHAGGLADFPWADVHVHEDEYQASHHPRGLMAFAYLQGQWAHQPRWAIHKPSGQKWYDFDAIQVLEMPEVDFFLIPLPGHTRGHCGVAVGKGDHWLLHCGDAASPYHQGGDLHQRGASAYHLKFLPDRMAENILGGHASRLRSFLAEHSGQVQAVSAHDLFSYLEYNEARSSGSLA